jgi:hypothetical protein
MNEKRIARLFGLTLDWTIRDQFNPECNHHLEWDDTVSL